MKQTIIVIVAMALAVIIWRVTESISSDALGLAIGVIFGVLAGLPTALLVLASNRSQGNQPQLLPQQAASSYQPPVVIINLGQPQRIESDEANQRWIEANEAHGEYEAWLNPSSQVAQVKGR